jgi:hypothetical protein
VTVLDGLLEAPVPPGDADTTLVHLLRGVDPGAHPLVVLPLDTTAARRVEGGLEALLDEDDPGAHPHAMRHPRARLGELDMTQMIARKCVV